MLQDHGGFYDRAKLFWKEIVDVTLLAACAPPGGGPQDMSARFTRHFLVLCMPPPSEVGLDKVGHPVAASRQAAAVQSRWQYLSPVGSLLLPYSASDSSEEVEFQGFLKACALLVAILPAR